MFIVSCFGNYSVVYVTQKAHKIMLRNRKSTLREHYKVCCFCPSPLLWGLWKDPASRIDMKCMRDVQDTVSKLSCKPSNSHVLDWSSVSGYICPTVLYKGSQRCFATVTYKRVTFLDGENNTMNAGLRLLCDAMASENKIRQWVSHYNPVPVRSASWPKSFLFHWATVQLPEEAWPVTEGLLGTQGT